MKRRQMILGGLGLAVSAAVVSITPRVLAKNGSSKRAFNYKNKAVEITEEGVSSDADIARAFIKSNSGKSANVDFVKVKRGFKTKYMTGYFPFGDEFDSVEEATKLIIDYGVLDLD